MIFKAVLSDNARKDGTRNVLIYIYAAGKKHRVRTEHYVKPQEFHKGKVRNRLNADYINASVSLKIAELEKNWLQDRNKGVKEVVKGKISLRRFADDYCQGIASGDILNNGKRFADSTVRGFKNSMRLLKEFLGTGDWQDVNQRFYDDYVNWMTEKGFMENMIARTIKDLKTLMKRGAKHHSNLEYVNFKAAYRDADTIALSEDEIDKVMAVELPEHLRAERERFYVSYNLLLRFGNSVKIDKRDIIKAKDRVLVAVRHEKTGNKAVIPLFKKAHEILKKNNYRLGKTTNQESNWKLKEIGKLAGINSPVTVEYVKGGKRCKETFKKYELMTTHTARRSMATNLFLAGLDLKQIQLMGGWRSMAVLEKYLKIDKVHNALKASEHSFFKD